MSTQKTASEKLSDLSTQGNVEVEPGAKKKQLKVEKIDVETLQIDENFDGCDPYNSTGQFLADAVKKKYEDS